MMADIVLNHVGYGDLSHGYNPFYKATYFHNCSLLASQNVGAVTSGNTTAGVSVFVWDICIETCIFPDQVKDTTSSLASRCKQHYACKSAAKASWLRGRVHAASHRLQRRSAGHSPTCNVTLRRAWSACCSHVLVHEEWATGWRGA